MRERTFCKILKTDCVKEYPLCVIRDTVRLEEPARTNRYKVEYTVVRNDGKIGNVQIFDLARNGFKIRVIGGCQEAELLFHITEEEE